VGVSVAPLCLAVVMWAGRHLPQGAQRDSGAALPYFLEARVAANSPLFGRTITADRLRNLQEPFLLEIVRRGRLPSPVAPQELIQGGDHLVVTGEVDNVHTLQRFAELSDSRRGLRPRAARLQPRGGGVDEAVGTPQQDAARGGRPHAFRRWRGEHPAQGLAADGTSRPHHGAGG